MRTGAVTGAETEERQYLHEALNNCCPKNGRNYHQTKAVNHGAGLFLLDGLAGITRFALVRVEGGSNLFFCLFNILSAGKEGLLAGFANGRQRIGHPYEPETTVCHVQHRLSSLGKEVIRPALESSVVCATCRVGTRTGELAVETNWQRVFGNGQNKDCF